MPDQATFPCPSCRTALLIGTVRCAACGIRLVGADAGRLREIDDQLAALLDERTRLVDQLLDPAVAPTEPLPALTALSESAPEATSAISGQQLLLGLGAVLLLSAAAAFLVVVWLVVGVVGQAAIMATITALASLFARWSTRRRLSATAETAGLLTVGLVVIDLAAARTLGLAGLGGVQLGWYCTGAGALAALLLVAADRLAVGRRDDESVRPVMSFLPAAGIAAAIVPWAAFAALHWSGAAGVSALGLVCLVETAAAVGAGHWLHRPGTPAWRSSVLPLAIGALVAAAGYLLAALEVGYDCHHAEGERYAAATLLLLFAVGLVGGSSYVRRSGGLAQGLNDRLEAHGLAEVPHAVPYVVVACVIGAIGVAALDVTAPILDVVAVVAGVLAVLVVPRTTAADAGPQRACAAGCGVIVFGAYVLVAATQLAGIDTVRHVALTPGVTSHAPSAGGAIAMMVPALVVVVTAVACLALTRWPAWVWTAQAAALGALVTALLPAASRGWMIAALVAAAALTIAALRANRGARAGAERALWIAWEMSSLSAWVCCALIAVVAADSQSQRAFAVALVVLGVLVLAYSASPDRLWWSYGGSALVSGGIDTWLASSQVHTVELYTAPLVVLLAVVGLVQRQSAARAGRTLPTKLTAGPALAVAFMPTLAVAIANGDTLRLSLVSAAAVIVLVIGLARAWKAPVTVSTFVLLSVALSQGGPLIGYVPSWAVLAAAGAALLAIGVSWERAILAGQRTHAWYGTLR